MTHRASKRQPTTIGGYEVLELVGEGGMATVYKARDPANGEIVAIKLVRPEIAGKELLLKRFEQEFRASSTLNHPNIVRGLGFGQEGRSPYIVMEFVDGESLGDRIERQGRLAEADAVRILVQTAEALHAAHQHGLIHRDLKPDNILLTRSDQAKLADLGLVKDVDSSLNLTRTGRGLGTPSFMAPEQFSDAKNANVKSDIYSLGATLYMVVTGRLPFPSDGPLATSLRDKILNKYPPPQEWVPNLSRRLDYTIRRAMSANPDDRPADCLEFIRQLTGESKPPSVFAEPVVDSRADPPPQEPANIAEVRTKPMLPRVYAARPAPTVDWNFWLLLVAVMAITGVAAFLLIKYWRG